MSKQSKLQSKSMRMKTEQQGKEDKKRKKLVRSTRNKVKDWVEREDGGDNTNVICGLHGQALLTWLLTVN